MLCVLALLMAGAPLRVIALQTDSVGTPAATTAMRGCNPRPASAAGLVKVLRQAAPADPDAADPRGDALPPNERAAVDEIVARWNACLASGDVRGLLGLFTADGVRRLLAEHTPYIGSPGGLRISVLGIGDVVRLRDGRIAARVSVDPSGAGTAPPEAVIFIIEQSPDGTWRIDHLSSPQGPVGAAGQASRDPQAAIRPLLRNPVAPGPNVTLPPPGPVVPMRGGDAARSGNQPGPVPEREAIEHWRAPTGWDSDAQPVVARGLVFFGGYSLGERVPLLIAVDAASGGVRWQSTAPVALGEFSDAPALAGDVLYAPVQAPVAGVLAIAAENGQALWFSPFGFTSVTAPAADAESIYIAGWGLRNARDPAQNDVAGTAFALDQRTGRERWRFLAPVRFGATALGKGLVFVPSDHGLYALDRATGHKRWQARFTPGPDQTPTVIGETLAFAGFDITSGKPGIFALDAASGALRWRADLPDAAAVPGATAATGDTLFVAWWNAPDGQPSGSAPTLHAYDLGSGEERWVFRAGPAEADAGGGTVTAPVIAGDVVLFGVSTRIPAAGEQPALDGLYAVDANSGTLRWHSAPSTPIGSAPAVLNGVVYAMGGSRTSGDATGGSLIAFSAE